MLKFSGSIALLALLVGCGSHAGNSKVQDDTPSPAPSAASLKSLALVCQSAYFNANFEDASVSEKKIVKIFDGTAPELAPTGKNGGYEPKKVEAIYNDDFGYSYEIKVITGVEPGAQSVNGTYPQWHFENLRITAKSTSGEKFTSVWRTEICDPFATTPLTNCQPQIVNVGNGETLKYFESGTLELSNGNFTANDSKTLHEGNIQCGLVHEELWNAK